MLLISILLFSRYVNNYVDLFILDLIIFYCRKDISLNYRIRMINKITMNFSIEANIVDVSSENTFYGEITIENKKISSIKKLSSVNYNLQKYILPGFIDA